MFRFINDTIGLGIVMSIVARIDEKFREMFGEAPMLVRSPGRVNLLGEHTDYNMGYVLPAAIDKAVYFAISPRSDGCCTVFSLDMDACHQFSPFGLTRTDRGWPNYLMGVVDQLVKSNLRISGFNCVFGGTIPIGAGMSSSAAIEAGLAFALNAVFDLGLDKLSLVKLAQKAENQFVGVQCGIMDQYVNIFGAQGNVLRLDCRSLTHTDYPFNGELAIVLFDTGVSHSLASTEYNRRREECGEGVEEIRKLHPGVTHLRDVSREMLQACMPRLGKTVARRCAYVVEENARVLEACRLLEQGDMKSFGRLMFRTHEGLRDEYEVSCKELDLLVELVADNPHVYGGRMMGGGFGGCTINLVERDAVEQVCAAVTRGYTSKYGVAPKSYVTSIASGTNIMSVNEQAAV